MSDEADVRKQIEQQLQNMTKVMGGYRRQSSIKIMGLPLYDIAIGPDFDKGHYRGYARGIIAIGDFATGWLAIGGLARGFVAIGGCALGTLALGGVAIGGLAVGGLAVGIIALGGMAIGYYAGGGGAFGAHVLSGMRQDPEMIELLKKLAPSK